MASLGLILYLSWVLLMSLCQLPTATENDRMASNCCYICLVTFCDKKCLVTIFKYLCLSLFQSIHRHSILFDAYAGIYCLHGSSSCKSFLLSYVSPSEYPSRSYRIQVLRHDSNLFQLCFVLFTFRLSLVFYFVPIEVPQRIIWSEAMEEASTVLQPDSLNLKDTSLLVRYYMFV